jgi:hypothetical protein
VECGGFVLRPLLNDDTSEYSSGDLVERIAIFTWFAEEVFSLPTAIKVNKNKQYVISIYNYYSGSSHEANLSTTFCQKLSYSAATENIAANRTRSDMKLHLLITHPEFI